MKVFVLTQADHKAIVIRTPGRDSQVGCPLDKDPAQHLRDLADEEQGVAQRALARAERLREAALHLVLP